MTTSKGPIELELFEGDAPKTVENFVKLSRDGFYDGVVFHRVIPGFVVQGGDPTGTGTGGPGYNWTGNTPPTSCEKNGCYPTGSVAMANTSGPTTNGSQFFIVLPGGDGQLAAPKYTLFGKVISGMKVVERIATDGSASGKPTHLHKMLKVTITQVSH